MSWSELQIFLWFFAVPSAFAFVFAYFYSDALMKGMAVAEDEQVRLTPQSPWIFFDIEFRPRQKKIILIGIPWMLVGTMLTCTFGIPTLSDPHPGSQISVLLGIVAVHVNLASFMAAGAVMVATSFRSAKSLTIAVAFPILFVWLWLLLFMRYAQFSLMKGLFHGVLIWSCGLGPGSLVLVWAYVRGRLNRMWFRFES